MFRAKFPPKTGEAQVECYKRQSRRASQIEDYGLMLKVMSSIGGFFFGTSLLFRQLRSNYDSSDTRGGWHDLFPFLLGSVLTLAWWKGYHELRRADRRQKQGTIRLFMVWFETTYNIWKNPALHARVWDNEEAAALSCLYDSNPFLANLETSLREQIVKVALKVLREMNPVDAGRLALGKIETQELNMTQELTSRLRFLAVLERDCLSADNSTHFGLSPEGGNFLVQQMKRILLEDTQALPKASNGPSDNSGYPRMLKYR